jgi:hypothetical protein
VTKVNTLTSRNQQQPLSTGIKQQPTTTTMYISIPAILLLSTLSLASPIPERTGNRRRQQFTQTISSRPYNQWQIADGQAGFALTEAEQRFPIVDRDPLSISDDELTALKNGAALSEASETGKGGSDERIASAKAQGQNTKALENGKTKMRVLRHQLDILALQVENARGEDNQGAIDDAFDAIRGEMAADAGNAGQGSTGISDTFVLGLATEVGK